MRSPSGPLVACYHFPDYHAANRERLAFCTPGAFRAALAAAGMLNLSCRNERTEGSDLAAVRDVFGPTGE